MKILFLMSVLLTWQAFAKQSRVIDVQESIKTGVEQYIFKFAPEAKYSVSVKVVPLTRNPQMSGDDELPFLDYEQENIADEWDDPIRSTFSLYSRIKEAQITLVFNQDINIKDSGRFKDALLKSVNLIPGRDRVNIETMSAPLISKEFNIIDHIDYLILASILFASMVLGIGLNTLSRKIGPPVKTENTAPTGNQMPMSSVGPGPRNSSQTNSSSSQITPNQGLSTDLNLEDPKRIHDMVKGRIDKLVKSGNFPTLNDLIILENEVKFNPKSFSYLVYEFPLDYQKKIYQLGRGTNWFNGFSEVGFPTKSILISLDKMLRSRNEYENIQYNELLVYMWRLEDQLPSFIKSIDKNIGLKLLKFFPKNISIPVARECYPGIWGEVLSESNEEFKINKSELNQMVEHCLKLKPLYKYEALQKYKSKTDLLNYLDDIEPHEEKEIYTIVQTEEKLDDIRAPFYSFFDLDEQRRREVFSMFSVSDWAVACFNIARKERELIKDIMDEKEKYLFSYALTELDGSSLDYEQRKDVRSHISQIVAELDDHVKSLNDLKSIDDLEPELKSTNEAA